MPVHPLDFTLQAHIFSTPESTAIFEETSRFQSWLDFEAALAASQAELGIIPPEAANVIKEKANITLLDLEFIKQEYSQNRNSLVPVLKALRQVCGPAGEYVHYGATTQDTLDTGQILAIKGILDIISRDIIALENLLLDMADRYRSQAMIGRTHSQQAIPITFGLKVAVWLSEIRRHIERLKSLRPRILAGQLSGAVGTMSALGEQGREVARLTMSKLGLTTATVSWHTSRDNIAETCNFFALLSATATKIANEIFQLGKTEIMELREAPPLGKFSGSSTMPHKRNPVICERIAAINSHVRALAGVTMETMLHENERDPRALWSEWLAVPQICIYTTAVLNYLLEVLQNLEVLPQGMLKNLHVHKNMILSEWLMFRLGRVMGKINAQDKLSRLIQEAESSGKSLKELLAADSEISSHLSPADLDHLDNPEKYTGLAARIVDDVIEEVMTMKENDCP